MKKRLQVLGARFQGKTKTLFSHSLTPNTYHLVPDSRGFTILLAALVASLVLTLGISVFSIAQKQVVLSSLGRSSQFAFYTADTAAECALYWDIRHDYFSSPSPGITPTCAGPDPLDIQVTEGVLGVLPYTMEFEFEPNGYCAHVSVRKSTVDPRTVIHADGFSTNCAEISISSRSLQRSVELNF
ncbi:hypothetical protein A3A38_02410 [Candidatus Kaiserbacteria bacterium RIFCSPLOWO2_01_FULL_53_17]|uniref:Type 4 fimbrial biogenesis protein PilX N-terminal domain-containing protein n=1 Tax=Candidatus Kaiserbacteria bacterium RIFCSPLOWO2_01_FULL_53_17 TaxID=1798511 RepID=A0A1F6EIQ8_9BACT|nr:MAG: hypothetical protein A3A38_02410 [Candidatus Kaiserbacteria bacterium RIFCSPLOWO2_01_FULL_53_17]